MSLPAATCGTSGSKFWLYKYFWPGRVVSHLENSVLRVIPQLRSFESFWVHGWLEGVLRISKFVLRYVEMGTGFALGVPLLKRLGNAGLCDL